MPGRHDADRSRHQARQLRASRPLLIVRIFIWSLFESKTTIDELRDALPELEEPSTWIWSEASERFGMVVFGDELIDELAQARGLIGRDPDVAEEFDALDL